MKGDLMAIINRDATATPLESPLTVSSTVLEIKLHTHASILHLRPVNADVRYGDNGTLDGTADEGYAVVKDGASLDIPVKNGASIYVVRDSSTDVFLSFHFVVMKD
jgi:hypothetical protein